MKAYFEMSKKNVGERVLKQPVYVLISGGVDSSVALKRLVDQGYDVKPYYLKVWLEEETHFLGDCPWDEDIQFASDICSLYGLKLNILSMQQTYYQSVVEYALEEISRGHTPNPDMLCNSTVKFGSFLDRMFAERDKENQAKRESKAQGKVGKEGKEGKEEKVGKVGKGIAKFSPVAVKSVAENEKLPLLVASGHYAMLEKNGGLVFLKMSKDKDKDQTYFLARMTQRQLQHCLFPIGDSTKAEIRKEAIDANLPTANRKDSQGICFLGKINFSDFVKHHLGVKKGSLVRIDTKEEIGEHQGHWLYTIGQRKGIGLSGGPWYVVEKDSLSNTVYISNGQHSRRETGLVLDNYHWLYPIESILKILDKKTDTNKKYPYQNKLMIRIRHRGELLAIAPSKGEIEIFFKDGGKEKMEWVLSEGVEGIAFGQFAVFYFGEYCLGSAVMERIRVLGQSL